MVSDAAHKTLAHLGRVPWSLVIRALIFLAAWLFLPFWFFFVIAVGMYLIPIFQPFLLFVPFLLALLLAGLLAKTFWAALFLAALFYLIIGIKDLVFIDRRRAYHILLFLLLLALFLNFFYHWPRPDTPLAALGLAVIFFFIFRGFLRYVVPVESAEFGQLTFAPAVGALLIGQLALILLVLPLSFWYQTALLFCSVVLLAEFLVDRARGTLDRRIILTNVSLALVFFSIVLALTRWEL